MYKIHLSSCSGGVAAVRSVKLGGESSSLALFCGLLTIGSQPCQAVDDVSEVAPDHSWIPKSVADEKSLNTRRNSSSILQWRKHSAADT